MATATMERARESVRQMGERMLTPEESAAWLGISRAKVYQLLATGAIPSFKTGGNRRVRLSELDAYVRRLEFEGGSAA